MAFIKIIVKAKKLFILNCLRLEIIAFFLAFKTVKQLFYRINMNYLVQTSDGSEYGPVTQEELIAWAKDGRLEHKSKVRNKLFKDWRKANEYDFLRPYMDEHVETLKNVSGGIKKFTTVNTGARSLTFSTLFRFTPATFTKRFMASVIDVIIVMVLWSILFIPSILLLKEEVVLNPLFSAVSIAIFATIFLLYFTWNLGTKACSMGYWFFGIIVVRATDGSQVFMGRAFMYSLGLLLFWWLTPLVIFVTPANRTFHEYLVDSRVILARRENQKKKGK